jgi:DNA-binding response OmpR family regulator
MAVSEKSVLIVEDDEALLEALDIKFKATGINHAVAHNGEDALAYLQKNKPDLILLDLILPGIDGWLVMEEIKKNKSWADIPVIIFSNLGIIQEIEKGKAMGAVDYMIKSNTSINDVVKIVKKHLGMPT